MASTGRRVGRNALLDAGVALLDEATLADVMSWVGTRALAERAGVVPSTVSHHFPNRSGDRANQHLARSIVEAAMLRTDGVREATRHAVTEVASVITMGDEPSIEEMAKVAAADVDRWSHPDHRAALTAGLLAYAAAPHDAEARRLAAAQHEGTQRVMAPMYSGILGVLGRTWTEGWDAQRFATAISAMANGFVLRNRVDPTPSHGELFGAATVELLFAATQPALPEKLRAHDALSAPNPAMELPAGSSLDRHKRDAIAAAAVELYQEGGWSAVNIASVTARAGVNRATVNAHFGGQSALAGPILSSFIPTLQRAIEADASLPFVSKTYRHLVRLAEISFAHRDLVGAFLASLSDHTSRGAYAENHPANPRRVVPMPDLLIELIQENPSQFRPGIVDTPIGLISFGVFVTRSCMAFAVGNYIDRPAAVADFIHDTVLAGALVDRPAVRGPI